MCVCVCARTRVCNICMPSGQGGQKRALHLLELNLQMFLSHNMGAEIQIWVLRQNNKCL